MRILWAIAGVLAILALCSVLGLNIGVSPLVAALFALVVYCLGSTGLIS